MFRFQWLPLTCGFLFALPLAGLGDDWPQWLGPQRDAVWRETGIMRQFPEGGPPVEWRTPIGTGYSGPAVADGRVYITDRKLRENAENPDDPFQRGMIPGVERVLCLDAGTGEILWKYEYDCPYNISYPSGPRATPVVDGGKVYTLGAMGHLNCFDSQTGEVIWSRQFQEDFGVSSPMWGFAAHPLIDGDRLICMVRGEGTTVVAFDKGTGEEIWSALSAREPGYCPPMIYEAGGVRQLIVWHPEALNSLNPETGEVYWSHPREIKSGLSIATPRKMNDMLFVTSFYDGPLMMKLDREKPAATVLWKGQGTNERRTDGLHSIISTPFLEDGYIYGVGSYGQFRCLDARTGERLWMSFEPTTGGEEARWANCFIIKNGDRYFLPNEKGDLIIARLSPEGYEEVSRAHLLEPTNRAMARKVVWSHPAFANRHIYARNDKELISVSLAAGEHTGE